MRGTCGPGRSAEAGPDGGQALRAGGQQGVRGGVPTPAARGSWGLQTPAGGRRSACRSAGVEGARQLRLQVQQVDTGAGLSPQVWGVTHGSPPWACTFMTSVQSGGGGWAQGQARGVLMAEPVSQPEALREQKS